MGDDEQSVKERLMAACSTLGPRQQQDLIHFIWLSAHAPERIARKVQRRLLDELERVDKDGERLAQALSDAVRTLAETLTDSE